MKMNIRTKHKLVSKNWGVEIWFENNKLYCGKLIYCNENWNSKERFHYHKLKDETFFIVDGILELDIKMEDQYKKYLLTPGNSFRIYPGIPHRFKDHVGSCRFIEVSTHHDDKDVFRCF